MEPKPLTMIAAKAWNAYQCNYRVVEFVLLCMIAVTLVVAWECDYIGGEEAKKSVALFAAIAGLSGTLLGFAITSMAILIGLFQSPEFGPLRKNENYDSIFADYKFAIVLLAATTLFALAATVATAAHVYSSVVLGITLGLVGWSSVTMAHAVEILWLAIKTHGSAEQGF